MTGWSARSQTLPDELARLLIRRELLEVGQVFRAAQPELLEKRRGRSVDDGTAALGIPPDFADKPLVDEEEMTPSELTPRMPLTISRVTGWWYATTASVSKAACERRWVSQDKTKASTWS